jgi:hypothetical protein
MGIFIVSKSWFPKMTRPFKTPTHSQTVMNELVLPNDTNTLNNLMGGRLLHWMDICAAIAAQKHANRIVVTASVDNVSFNRAIRLGNLVNMTATVTRPWRSAWRFGAKTSLREFVTYAIKPISPLWRWTTQANRPSFLICIPKHPRKFSNTKGHCAAVNCVWSLGVA